MKDKIIFLFCPILYLISCNGVNHGKPVPLGDEFEDHWHQIDWQPYSVIDIAGSQVNSGEFFILTNREIFQTVDTGSTFMQIFSSGTNLRTFALSDEQNQRLLIVAESLFIYLLKGKKFTSIDTHSVYLSDIDFVAFYPQDTNIFFVGNRNLILCNDDMGNFYDTIFHSSNIKSFDVSWSDNLYITMPNVLVYSNNKGVTWDTIYQGTGISDICVDKEERIYLLFSDRIKTSSDGGNNWEDYFVTADPILTFSAIDNGLIVITATEVVEAYKVESDHKVKDMSFGIVVGLPDYENTLLAISENMYLLSIADYEYEECEFFYFLDTALPP